MFNFWAKVSSLKCEESHVSIFHANILYIFWVHTSHSCIHPYILPSLHTSILTYFHPFIHFLILCVFIIPSSHLYTSSSCHPVISARVNLSIHSSHNTCSFFHPVILARVHPSIHSSHNTCSPSHPFISLHVFILPTWILEWSSISIHICIELVYPSQLI